MDKQEITDGMALAFHYALNDGSIGKAELEDIKDGLRAAFNAWPRPVQQKPIGAFAEVFEASNALIEDINAEYAAHLATEDYHEAQLAQAQQDQYRKSDIVEAVGEVRHYATPANLPAYVNVKWHDQPPKDGTKLYVVQPTEQYQEIGTVTLAGLNRFPKMIMVEWTGAVTKGDKLYVKTPKGG